MPRDPRPFADEPEAITARWGRHGDPHGSALYLHSLSDRLPFSTDTTIPREHNTVAIIRAYPNVGLHRCGKKTYPLGIQVAKGLAGAPVRAHDPGRCACGILDLRKRGKAVVQLLKGTVRDMVVSTASGRSPSFTPSSSTASCKLSFQYQFARVFW